MVVDVVFFFKQKTAYEMRISDWSSDVCSSDLHLEAAADRARGTGRDACARAPGHRPRRHRPERRAVRVVLGAGGRAPDEQHRRLRHGAPDRGEDGRPLPRLVRVADARAPRLPAGREGVTHEEPCAYCDFIGPFVSAEQPVRDFHRMWHDYIRTLNRAFGPLIAAFNALAEATADAKAPPVKDTYRLAGPTKGDST